MTMKSVRSLLAGCILLLVCFAPAQAAVHGLFVPGYTALNGFFDTSAYPFADFLKQRTSCSSSAGFAYPGVLDANQLPSTASLTQNINCQVPIPSTACTVTVHCVLDWVGTNGVSSGAPGAEIIGNMTVVSGCAFVAEGTCGTTLPFHLTSFGVNGSIEFYFNSVPGAAPFDFTSGSNYSLTRMRLYRLSDQAAVNANANAFNLDTIALLRSLNPRVLRLKDWSNTDNNLITGTDGELPTTASSFSTGNWMPSKWAGQAGGTDTYTATLAGFTLTDGATIQLQIVNANTGTTPTLNVNSLGNITIIHTDATALSAGSLAANGLYTFIYDAGLNELIVRSGNNAAAVPTAIQVALCNMLNFECGISIPTHATLAAATQIGTTVCGSANLLPHFAYSNEIWNFGFAATSWAAARGAAIGFPAGNNERYHGLYALRFRQFMAAIATACGSRAIAPQMEFQAFGNTGQTDTYRFKGGDLTLDVNGSYTTGLGGAGSGLAVVTNYSSGTVGGIASQGSPISIAMAHSGALSYASYYSGAVMGATYSGSYAAGDLAACSVAGTNSGGLQCAADNFALGTPTAIAAAFAWIDNDIRAGTKNGSAGFETVASLNTNVYPGWNTLAAGYSLPIIGYEGGAEGIAPTVAQCGTISFPGTAATYCGTGGLINAALAGYKLSASFQQLVTDQITQMTAASPAGSRVAWFTFSLSAPPNWSLFLTTDYTQAWTSFQAISNYNHSSH